MEGFPILKKDGLDADQRVLWDELTLGPRGILTGGAAAERIPDLYNAWMHFPAFGHLMQLFDQVFVGALGLGLGGFQAAENFLDAIDARQDQRNGFGPDRHAVAEFAHQRFAGVRQRFQPRQPEETASALDRVDQAEDIIQNLRVARVLLEPD